jgi:hypothetical protein
VMGRDYSLLVEALRNSAAFNLVRAERRLAAMSKASRGGHGS